jgi:hypothetical protein
MAPQERLPLAAMVGIRLPESEPAARGAPEIPARVPIMSSPVPADPSSEMTGQSETSGTKAAADDAVGLPLRASPLTFSASEDRQDPAAGPEVMARQERPEGKPMAVFEAAASGAAPQPPDPPRAGENTPSPSPAAPHAREIYRREPEAPAAVKPAVERIELQVETPGQGRVQVQVMDRGDGVHIALRASHEQSIERIRENLPELANSLDRQGFEAAVWRPESAADSGQTGGEQSNRELFEWHGGRRGRQHPQEDADPHRGDEVRFAELLGEGEGQER